MNQVLIPWIDPGARPKYRVDRTKATRRGIQGIGRIVEAIQDQWIPCICIRMDRIYLNDHNICIQAIVIRIRNRQVIGTRRRQPCRTLGIYVCARDAGTTPGIGNPCA